MRLVFIFLFYCTPLSSFSQINLSEGLIAYYPFDGNAKDASGNNNNPRFNNAVLTSDRFGNSKSAYKFNGRNSFMQIPNSVSLNFKKSITIAAWIYATDFYSGLCHGNRVIMKGVDGYTDGNYMLTFDDHHFTNGQNCNTNTPDYIHQTFYGVDLGKNKTYIKKAQWYFVVYTSDGISSKLYVNCELISNEKAQQRNFSNNEDLFIGKMDNSQYPYWFTGILDDVRIYNRALSSNEILQLCDKNNSNNILQEPSAEISYSIEKCNKINVELTNAVQIKSVKWQIENLYSSTKEKFSYKFKKEGEYSIDLTFTGNNGITKTISKKIIIKKPFAEFTFKNNEENKFSFKTTSKEKANLLWNFGDGSSEKNSRNALHTYVSSGSFTVSLIAVDKNGCSDTAFQNITIEPLVATKIMELNGDNGRIKPMSSTETKGIDFLPEERMNTLIQQIEVQHDSIEISFYDNGTIDGDSITVQFNNKIITQHLLLTATGKSFYIKIDPTPATNELIMFAENLGTIPPNTALMIIYDGKKRHEININSSKTNNGMVSFVLKK